jgi:hypothetical protein
VKVATKNSRIRGRLVMDEQRPILEKSIIKTGASSVVDILYM